MSIKLLLLWILNLLSLVTAVQIVQYNSSLVSLKDGNGWILEGNFRLIHVINLEKYMEVTTNTSYLIERHIPSSNNRGLILYHLHKIREWLGELTHGNRRQARSINWIGSAWKWLAGNPDASDWDDILRSQCDIVTNNDEQYKLHRDLQQKSDQAIQKVNEMIERLKI